MFLLILSLSAWLVDSLSNIISKTIATKLVVSFYLLLFTWEYVIYADLRFLKKYFMKIIVYNFFLLKECTKEEMADFPRRMRDWLFNIMRDLADRQELTPHYLNMEREAESNMTRRWTNAAIWKFCDLDGNPPDR